MGFGPFGRAQQPGFFTVPGAKDNRSFRSPARFGQLTRRSRLFEQSHEAADGISGSVDPGIVMIAANHPFVRTLAAAKTRNQMNCRFARTHVIGDRQRATPGGGRDRAFERSQQRKGIGIGDRQYRDLGEGLCVFNIEALRIGCCADARCERIPRI